MDLDQFISGHVNASPQQRCFFHFTDARNLVSIKEHGLMSTRELKRRKIVIPACGGNQWSLERDEASGMDAYVHLCFKTGHPMEKRATDEGNIQNLVRLEVNPRIIKVPGVMITNDVSNKVGVGLATADQMLDNIDLEVLYKRTDWKDPAILQRLKAAEKCEILVPSMVPVGYILNL